jgi:protein-disulfide isomerase
MDETRRNGSLRLGIAAAIVLLVGLIALIRSASPSPAKTAAAPAVSAEPQIQRYQVPVTASQPAKGPSDAMVTIVEWCNLTGPECKKVDAILDEVMKQYPDQVRLVFRHFMTEGAPTMGDEFARIAFDSSGAKFWQARDLLRSGKQPPSAEDLQSYAKQLELDWSYASNELASHSHNGHVLADRLFASMFDVHEVPAFFVNGRRLQGEASVPDFKTLIDDEMQRAGKLVAQGIPRTQVYAELTKNGSWKQVRPN